MINAKTTILIEISNISITKANNGEFYCKITGRRYGQLNTLHFFLKDKLVFMEIAKILSSACVSAVYCNVEVELDCNGKNPKMYIKGIVN